MRSTSPGIVGLENYWDPDSASSSLQPKGRTVGGSCGRAKSVYRQHRISGVTQRARIKQPPRGQQHSTIASFGEGYAQSLARVWDHPQTAGLKIRFNTRLKATLARWVASGDVIELNPSAANRSAKERREIICHEAAHRAVHNLYGRSARPHGPEWRALVEAAGFEARTTLFRCGELRRRASSALVYRHVCPVCHFSKRAKRRIARWRCPECHAIGLEGKLHVERIMVR